MAKKRRKTKARRKLHTSQPSPDSAQATKYFQQEIRQSPLWARMVAEFGEEEAIRLLQEFRLDIH